MKLKEINSLLGEFEAQNIFYQLWSGHRSAALQLRENLTQLPPPYDRDLSATDFLKLMALIPSDTSFPVVKEIKSRHCSYRTDEVFQVLLTPPISILGQIFELLFLHGLLSTNPKLIDAVLSRKNTLVDLDKFYLMLIMLQKHSALEVHTVNRLFQLMLSENKLKNYDNLINLFRRDIADLHLTQAQILTILTLKPSKQEMLCAFTKASKAKGYLPALYFYKILGLISAKLPTVALTDAPLHKLKTGDIYAVHENKKAALHEIKYLRLLDHPATYSLQRDVYVIAPALPGKPLSSFTNEELSHTPIKTRLKWVTSILRQIDRLHENYRVHGNITFENCLLNSASDEVKLKNFAQAHKRAFPSYKWTGMFRDPSAQGSDFSNDLYALSEIILKLFPDLFNYSSDENYFLRVPHWQLTVPQKAIQTLVSSLHHVSPVLMYTSDKALKCCEKVLENFEQLTNESLNCICTETLWHKAPTQTWRLMAEL